MRASRAASWAGSSSYTGRNPVCTSPNISTPFRTSPVTGSTVTISASRPKSLNAANAASTDPLWLPASRSSSSMPSSSSFSRSCGERPTRLRTARQQLRCRGTTFGKRRMAVVTARPPPQAKMRSQLLGTRSAMAANVATTCSARAASLACGELGPTQASSSPKVFTEHRLVFTLSLPAKLRSRAVACLHRVPWPACVSKCLSAMASPPPALICCTASSLHAMARRAKNTAATQSGSALWSFPRRRSSTTHPALTAALAASNAPAKSLRKSSNVHTLRRATHASRTRYALWSPSVVKALSSASRPADSLRTNPCLLFSVLCVRTDTALHALIEIFRGRAAASSSSGVVGTSPALPAPSPAASLPGVAVLFAFAADCASSLCTWMILAMTAMP
mmetsp:Transcript_22788/g.41827  ORF Transcript_22788/g.41827 Transcript_22788/m.41827 type:complete len:392 (+) Transcript_22788:50-1225(+)